MAVGESELSGSQELDEDEDLDFKIVHFDCKALFHSFHSS